MSATATIPMPDADAVLLLPEEVCKRLRISARTLARLTAAGEIAVIRIGRSIRYTPAAVQTWIENAQQAGQPKGA